MNVVFSSQRLVVGKKVLLPAAQLVATRFSKYVEATSARHLANADRARAAAKLPLHALAQVPTFILLGLVNVGVSGQINRTSISGALSLLELEDWLNVFKGQPNFRRPLNMHSAARVLQLYEEAPRLTNEITCISAVQSASVIRDRTGVHDRNAALRTAVAGG